MARQAAKAKLGFYPIDPYCMESIIGHLSLSAKDGAKGVNIIDPCCGKGDALNQIAATLGIPWDQVYGVELDGNRVKEAQALMPEAKIVGPASLFGMKVTGHSFSLVYINPPFDDELGGGKREEQSFVEEAWRMLTGGGVMVLVCPLSAMNGNRAFCQYVDSRFEDLRLFVLPDGISKTTCMNLRSFHEIVVIARKRRVIATEETVKQYGSLHQASFEWKNQIQWEKFLSRINHEEYMPPINGATSRSRAVPRSYYGLPASWKPMQFHKSQYLPHELAEALQKSPLQSLCRDVEPFSLARPPLPPGKGHVALLLASGQLDGVVESEDGSHVVRGTAKKTEYWNEAASDSKVNPETGALTTKDVFSQKVVLIIRAAWQDGAILTLSDQPAPDTDEPAEDTNEGREPRIAETTSAGVTVSARKVGDKVIMSTPGDDPGSRLASLIYATGRLDAKIPPWQG